MGGERILIMAGGTGGHIFPALAVAHELLRRGAEVSWLGTRAGLEADVVPRAGLSIDYIEVAALRGKGAARWLLAPFTLGRALWQALRLLRRRRPHAVLGMGGFVTGPGGVAAWLLRRPLVIHEQNARAGLTNRLLARLARRVLAAFPDALPGAEVCGNPVRQAILSLPAPARRLAERNGPLRLLVVGGSQGALALNRTLPEALARLAPDERPQVRHQSGSRNRERVLEAYRAAGIAPDGAGVEVLPFIEEMAEAYTWADLVLCRAGALTVSELAAAGLPSILVPFPFAVDDHQTHNARYLANVEAAVLLPQPEMSAERLAGLLAEFSADAAAGRKRLLRMGEAARRIARPQATERVAECCLEVAGGGR